MEFREKPMQNLIRIKEKEICKNVQALLLDGESIVGAYKTVRDQAVFTSHRIFKMCIRDSPLMWPTAPVCRTSKTPRAALSSAI